MKPFRTLTAAALAFFVCGAAQARVDNFRLLDQHGASHELYYSRDANAVAIMIQGNGCAPAQSAWPGFRALRDAYESRGVEFLMLNSSLGDDRESVLAETKALGIDIPVLIDETQLIGESLDLEQTGEVLIIDPASWEIVYRGPLAAGAAGASATAAASGQYARDAIEAVLTGATVAVPKRAAQGCQIAFPNADGSRHETISYSETIAPILEENCVACHRPGGLGPWAMTEYNMVLGFAPMIREVLRTDRMPPWDSDPHVGHWIGDRNLSTEELQTLVHWIEAGAPRGDGPDPLTKVHAAETEWPLGEPDLIVSLPAYAVPATGVVDYQYPFVENPLDHDVWVRAVAIAPGDTTVVHHVLAGHSTAVPQEGSESNVFENYLHGYAPGAEAAEFPEATGTLIPQGGAFVFQMHYTPVGRAATDVTRLGLYFYDERPERVLRHNVVVNPEIEIPPGAARHEERAYLAFDKDAILYSLFPHAHYRGFASSFSLQYPDGTEELLLSVPKYDFNWQRAYAFTEPLPIPAGSRLIHTTVYDNSDRNPANPDADRVVPWGLQSWDEMLYGAVAFRWKDETAAAPIHDPMLARLQQMYGYTDRNMDGLLSLEELPVQQQRRLAANFDQLDRDGNGGLDIAEYQALMRR
jgi:hypothetical protein